MLIVHYLSSSTMMDSQEIAYFIRTSGIGVDPYTITETLTFLENHVGLLSPELEHYQIFAATAIVGETRTLSDITNTKWVRSGITLEHVMRHIGKLSKEQYLDVVTRQVSKWREAPLWLKAKTQNLKISYRIYKKYRAVFDDLCKGNPFSQEKNRFNLMAIFWIVYLFIKNENAEFDNTVKQATLLHSVILFTFSEISVSLTHKQSSSIFRKQFSESQTPGEDNYNHIKSLILSKLNETVGHRHKGEGIDLKQLANNHYTQRYLDDIGNLYDKFQERLPENRINEISFLELAKNLTPLAIKVTEYTNKSSITKRIDFTKSDDEDDFDMDDQAEGNEEKKREQEVEDIMSSKYRIESMTFQPSSKREPASPFRVFTLAKEAPSPVSARHMNSNWLNGITSNIIKEQAQETYKIYERYAKRDYKNYQDHILKIITNAIYEFTPDCIDFTKRQQQIYHLFRYFINRIAENHTVAEMTPIFSQDGNYSSILCLTIDIFNYANQSLSGSYRKNCKIFGITLLQGHKAISWLAKHITMPKSIETYLFLLQKRILIEELWEDNEGYSILSNEEELIRPPNQALFKRLEKHVNQRTQELCLKMNIQQKEVTRIVNLVKYILQKRVILLKNHRIDQIIVCAIASILSINRSSSQFSLEEVFNYYNQLILSYYSNKNNLYDYDGNQIDLISFYNLIFLPSVEDIINSDQHSSILATPIRIERQKSRQLGLEMTPIAKKFRQIPTLSIPSRKLTAKDYHSIPENQDDEKDMAVEEPNPMKKSYKTSIIQVYNSLRNLDDNDQEQECQSPTFGGGNNAPTGVYRTFSFGDFDKI